MAKRRKPKPSQPACPRCGAALAANSGVAEEACRSCGLGLVLAWFEPAIEPGPRPLPVANANERSVPCAQHVGNEAVASCNRCGGFMCQLCRIDADKQALCPACFDRLANEGSLDSAAKTFRNYNGMALHTGGVSLLLSMPFGIIGGPAAVIMAIKGYRQGLKRGEHFSRSAGIIGGILGVLSAAIGLFTVLALAHVIGSRGG